MLLGMELSIARPRPAAPAFFRWMLGAGALVLGFAAGAWAAGLGPFDGMRPEPSPGERTMRALPFDAPVPDGAPASAGAGLDLPYAAIWQLDEDFDTALAGLTARMERDQRWRITFEREVPGGRELTAVRYASDGLMTHFARVTVTGDGARARLTFEFIPMAELASH